MAEATLPVVSERDAPIDLPARYHVDLRDPFRRAFRGDLAPGACILDIGSGRNPSVEVLARPRGTHYTGLDLSEHELAAAGGEAYDERVVADAVVRRVELVGRFDLALSWQVLEHVRPLDAAVANVHSYLRPGGRFVAFFSGKWSAFGIANMVLPDRLAGELVGRLMRRRDSSHPVFPAYYDDCYDRALRTVFSDWTALEVVPFYRGATYFHFSKVLSRLYLAYENAACRGHPNLATHYLIVATR